MMEKHAVTTNVFCRENQWRKMQSRSCLCRHSKICNLEGTPGRFPFNVSKVNDTMRGINKDFHISNTPFNRFSVLLADVEADGLHIQKGKDSVRLH